MRVSRLAVVAMIVVAVAGAVLTVVVYEQGRGSTDGQEALVVPFAIFWTVVAVTLIWMIDGFLRAARGYLDRSS